MSTVSANEPLPTGRKTSTTALAAVALVVTFVAGALVGIVVDRYVRFNHPPPPPRGAAFLMQRLDHRLDLTPQQEAEVTKILEKHQQRMRAVWTNVNPQLGREIEETNAEIERILTPGQRAKFADVKMRLMPRRDRRGIRFRHD
jgi:heavy-metal resistance protein